MPGDALAWGRCPGDRETSPGPTPLGLAPEGRPGEKIALGGGRDLPGDDLAWKGARRTKWTYPGTTSWGIARGS